MLWINGKRLIPAPTVNISKNFIRSEDGRQIGANYSISLKGTILPTKGSPLSTGFWTGTTEPAAEVFTSDDDRHNSLLAKQEFIRELFNTQNLTFKYEPSGLPPVECYPSVNSIQFAEGLWVLRTDYTIDLDTPSLNRSGTTDNENAFALSTSGYYLTKATDNTQISQREDVSGIFQITRNVSATAMLANNVTGVIGTEPWLNAKAWVQNRLSGTFIEANIFNLPTGVNATGYYNLVQEETADKTAGNFSVNRRYTYSAANVFEQRNITRNITYPKLGDLAPTVEQITVNGTINGLTTDNNPSGKIVNAYAYWNTLYPNLGTVVGAYGSGTNLQLTEDYSNGTLNYSLQFINNSGSTYKHTYDVSYTSDNTGLPTVGIQGQIEGITNDDMWKNGGKFNAAVSGWGVILPQLKTLAFAYAGGSVFGSGITSASFADNPINKTIGFNKPNGIINYSLTYGSKDGSSSNNYTDQYQIEVATNNTVGTDAGLITTVSINGTINGLSTTDDPAVKLQNAQSGWQDVKALTYSRASGYAGLIGPTPNLVDKATSKTLGINRLGGSITYNVSYTNALSASGTNVALADVTVEDTLPASIMVVQQIPGRAVGPIIQNIGTVSEYRRTVNITLTMTAKNTSGYWAYSDKNIPKTVASGYLTSVVSDLGVYGSGWWITGNSENWDWKNGLYTKNIQILASGNP